MKQQHFNMIAGGSLLAVLLGVALGYYAAEIMAGLSFLGQIYLAALRLVVVPLIISAIVVGISTIGNAGKSIRVIGKTLGYIVGSTALAVIIGLIVALFINPSAPELQAFGGPAPEGMVTMIPSTLGGLLSALISPNLFALFSQGRFLGLILFVLALSVALLGLRGYSSRNNLFQFFRTLHQACLTVIQWLLYVTPLGILFLVGAAVARGSGVVAQVWSGLGVFTLAMVIALLVHAVIALPLILRFLGDQPVLGFLRDLTPGLTSGFATASSISSLPLIYDGASEQSDVDHRASAAALPLGHTINMHGTAIYAVVAAVFVANVYAVDISFVTWLLIGIGALFVAIGTPGIPGAAALSLAVIFNVAGFPPEAYAGLGLMFTVDWFFDRLRTPINLWGNAVGAAVIGNTFEFKTAGNKSRTEQRGHSDRSRSQRDSRGGGRERQDRRGSERGRGRDDRRDNRRDDRRSDRRSSDRRSSGGRDERRSSDRGRSRDRDDNQQRSSERPSRPESRQRSSEQTPAAEPIKQDSKSPFAVSADSQPALGPTELEHSDKASPRDDSQQRGRGRRTSDRPDRSERGRSRGDREDRPQRGDRRRGGDQQRGRGRSRDESSRNREQEPKEPESPASSDISALNRASVAAQLIDSQSRRQQQAQEESESTTREDTARQESSEKPEAKEKPREQTNQEQPEPQEQSSDVGSMKREAFRKTVAEQPDEDRIAAQRTPEPKVPEEKPEPEKPAPRQRESEPQKPAPQPKEQESEKSSEEDKPIEFGRRGRSRRATSKPGSGEQSDASKSTPADVEVQPTEFDTDEMEFGRGKRRQKKG